MLKQQRDDFGISPPVLGRFTRKYMQHRPRTHLGQINIYAGKAIIYSLLPITENLQFSEHSDDVKLSEKEKIIALDRKSTRLNSSH